MARVHNNIFVRGLTGAIGDQFVIRKTRSGETIIANKPKFDPNREFTAAQLSQQERFKSASIYAKVAQKNAVYREKAAGTPLSAYNLAMADHQHKPEVLDIEINRWNGQVGQKIYIRAQDDFMVSRVRIVIRPSSENYDAVEGGEAVRSETDGLLWIFTATKPVQIIPGMQLDAYAYDMPGNLGRSSLVME